MSVRRLTAIPGCFSPHVGKWIGFDRIELDFMGLEDNNRRRMEIRILRAILWFANPVLSVLRSWFFGNPCEI